MLIYYNMITEEKFRIKYDLQHYDESEKNGCFFSKGEIDQFLLHAAGD